jgi:predicted dehydrogenase
MIRLAIAGLGWWGRHLFDEIAAVDEIEVVMGIDPGDEGHAFCKERGVDYASSLDEALASDQIDGVLLATPHSLHEAQVVAAVAAGKQVFCEKPLALSAEGARRMVEACIAAGKVLGVGHERRFESGFERLSELVASGRLGTISHIDANVSHNTLARMPAAGWRKDPKEAPAGNWTGVGIHLSDLIVSMMGSPTAVRALANSPYPGLDDAVVRVQLGFANGSDAVVTTIANTPFYARFTVYGNDGWAELVDQANVDKGKPASLTITDANGDRTTEQHSPKNASAANLRSWARAVLYGEPYRFKAEELIANAAILEGLVSSIRNNGDVVTLNH